MGVRVFVLVWIGDDLDAVDDAELESAWKTAHDSVTRQYPKLYMCFYTDQLLKQNNYDISLIS